MSDSANQGLEYNSDRDGLIIPEYGRNVQKMIEVAKTIENPRARQRFVEKVVDMMMMMHPQNRNMEDYREKLWKHVFRIGKYELDVKPPFGDIPKPDDMRKHPEKIEYPIMEARFRHYGHNVQVLIKKAIAMPQGPKREGFVNTIASYMKLAYKTWNRDHYVSDDVIKSDLESLSGGQLSFTDSTSIDSLSNKMVDPRRTKKAGPSNGRDRDRDRDRDNGGAGKQRARTYRRKK
jgi:hypothetical protein